MTTTTMEKPAKVAMNGVDVPAFAATLGAVKGTPAIAAFTFRAACDWQTGTHTRTRFPDFFGVMSEHGREDDHAVDSDHPTVLGGGDAGATPVEMVLGALSACITAGIGNIASMRQVRLDSVETRIEGDIDLNGILGLDEGKRNGFTAIRATVRISGDAEAGKLEEIVRQSMARSAVLDIVTNGVPVTVVPQAV